MSRNVLSSFVAGTACGVAVMLFWMRNASNSPSPESTPAAESAASQEEHSTPESPPEETAVLVVSAETIPPHELLTAKTVTLRTFRKRDVPPDAMRTIDQLEGLVLKSSAYRGDVITRQKLMDEADVVAESPAEPQRPLNLEIPALVVTVGTILPNQPITEEMVTVRPMRISEVPPGALQKSEELQGRVLRSMAYQGDVITIPKLVNAVAANAPSLSPAPAVADPTSIPPGFRVYTVSVIGASAIAVVDVMRPNDLVDVYVSYKSQNVQGSAKMTTKLILDSMRVFAVGNQNSDQNTRNVSLLVDPKQAQIVMMAQNKGTLHLVLRSKKK